MEVPAIPGCFSDGHTVEEARERVRDAILNFMDELTDSGEPPGALGGLGEHRSRRGSG